MKGYSAMALDVLQQALDEGPLEDVWALSAALKALDLVAQRRLAAPALPTLGSTRDEAGRD